MKIINIFAIAAATLGAIEAFKLNSGNINTGNPIPICNGSIDGDDCVQADDVVSPNKQAHGYKQDFEWSHD